MTHYHDYYTKKLQTIPVNAELKKRVAARLFHDEREKRARRAWFLLPSAVALTAAVVALAVTFIPRTVPVPFTNTPEQPITAETLLAQAQELPAREGEVTYLKTVSTFTFPFTQQPTEPTEDIEEFWTDGKNYERQILLGGEEPWGNTLALKNNNETYTMYTYNGEDALFQLPGMDEPQEIIARSENVQLTGLSDQFQYVFGEKMKDPALDNTPSPIKESLGFVNSWWAFFLGDILSYEGLRKEDPAHAREWITSVEKAHIVSEETVDGKETYFVEAKIDFVGERDIFTYRGWIAKDDHRFVKEEIQDSHTHGVRKYEAIVAQPEIRADEWFDVEQWKERHGITHLPEYELGIDIIPGGLKVQESPNE